MRFAEFRQGFTRVEPTGELLNWEKGVPSFSGACPAVFRRELEKEVPFAVEVAFEERPCPGMSEEGCRIEIAGAAVLVSAPSKRGLLYGAQTLCRFAGVEDKRPCVITDEPLAPERGLKLYLPPPDEAAMKEFFHILDLALRYKYNFVMLELGGAMPYASHPEINEAYPGYAAFMNGYPGKAMKIQNQYPWRKNSIHTDNGGGRVLGREQVAAIIRYCRERELEIVPEVPCLSHCDYILAAHPEFAERREDPYPDTACPSNEAYCKLLFDILDEVAEVFRPRRIHIGHDEYYSIGLCPACRGKSAPRIYADDVARTAAHLRSLGVTACIWGEKLLDSRFLSGAPCGGAEIPPGEGLEGVPAVWPAVDLIPKDVEIFHWYWSIDRKLDEVFDARGFKYLFGNFGPAELPAWRERSARRNFRGVCVSNWGRSDWETMRRNGILFDLICASCLCWNPALGSEDFAKLYHTARAELEQLSDTRQALRGFPLTLTHTVTAPIGFRYFFDGYFINEADFLLGHHIFLADTGEEVAFPVFFGQHISNAENPPERKCDPFSAFDRYELNRQHIEILGGARPVRGEDGRFFYQVRYDSPFPPERLVYKEFRPTGKFTCKVELKR